MLSLVRQSIGMARMRMESMYLWVLTSIRFKLEIIQKPERW